MFIKKKELRVGEKYKLIRPYSDEKLGIFVIPPHTFRYQGIVNSKLSFIDEDQNTIEFIEIPKDSSGLWSTYLELDFTHLLQEHEGDPKVNFRKSGKKSSVEKAPEDSSQIIKEGKMVVYGCPYIEVEFGQRDEGWSLCLDLERLKKKVLRDSQMGAYTGGGIMAQNVLRLSTRF